AVVTLLGSLGFVVFEKDMKFGDALWWSIVTLTTVGYGDISPATLGGRLVGITIMVAGIGFLGTLTATIASIFVENRLLENRGMHATEMKDHFIICGWNFRGQKIVEELRADPKCRHLPLVVLADLPEKPVQDSRLHFIAGEVEADTLKRANIDEARVVIVLSDERLNAYSRDAKTVLTTLTIESVNPNVYTCVELMDERNVPHCKRAHADEIIVAGELAANLLVQAALDHGITRMISELVSNRVGEELFKVPLPADLAGKTFFEALCRLKEDHDILCLGLEDADGKNLVANPDKDHRLSPEDRLIVIARDRPDLT
ncbi:MAG: potassium channel family protein, partial [Desulfococcaceae bacterium]